MKGCSRITRITRIIRRISLSKSICGLPERGIDLHPGVEVGALLLIEEFATRYEACHELPPGRSPAANFALGRPLAFVLLPVIDYMINYIVGAST
jgi:hypothetical protein